MCDLLSLRRFLRSADGLDPSQVVTLMRAAEAEGHGVFQEPPRASSWPSTIAFEVTLFHINATGTDEAELVRNWRKAAELAVQALERRAA